MVPQRFDNILVPLDGSSFSENALDYAGELAAAFGAGITLFRATPQAAQFRARTDWSHNYGGPGFGYTQPYELAASLAEASKEYLWRKADALQAKFPIFDVTVQQSLDNPPEAILRLTDQMDNALVVMATHGRRAMGRALFGSIADHIVRHSGSPTLLIRGPMPIEAPAGEFREDRESSPRRRHSTTMPRWSADPDPPSGTPAGPKAPGLTNGPGASLFDASDRLRIMGRDISRQRSNLGGLVFPSFRRKNVTPYSIRGRNPESTK